MTDDKVTELIHTAIKREEQAQAFYADLVSQFEDADIKETLAYMAAEEKKHKDFLVDYLNGVFGEQNLRMSEVIYYRIAEYQQEPDLQKDPSRANVFLVASHRERRSHQFYTEMAQLHPEGEVRDLLLKMANEELKHKEKMEYLYSNTAFPQTSGG